MAELSHPMAELTHPLWQAARRHADRPALIEGERVLSFAALYQDADALARHLAAQGVHRGDHLLLLEPDPLPIIRCLWATSLLGCVCIPLNPALPVAQIERQLATADARWLIGAGSGEEGEHIKLPPGCQQLGLPPLSLTATNAPLAATPEWPPLDPQTALTGTFTSGSSGHPKLALHSLANHRASAKGSGQLIPLGAGDGWGLTLPLYHIGGLAILFRCLLAGASLVLGERRDLEGFLQHPRVTHLSVVATQLVRLQRQGRSLAAGSLRHLLLGGSAFPRSLLDWLAGQPIQCHISYGLTEMSSQVMTGPANPDSRIAHLLPGRELRIAPIAGDEGQLEPGEEESGNVEGEILVRGDCLWLGYYQRGQLHRPLNKEGWFHTRDRGQLDTTGALRVIGRLDNQFVSGGENVQPEPLEAIIRSFAGGCEGGVDGGEPIDECYLVPVSDAEYGTRAVCFVEPFPADGGAELARWLQPQLASHQRPRAFYPIPPELKRGLKISRQQLCRWAEEQSQG
ncbi:AMP-binding protein [Aestuariirhabdus litorea]|uniref:2-succinylbenzoate-CoA ligase n=1 Tax=Aestuariirhabdus litorea TaxID=2528527 RepID=A0A3P3VIG8_9GAMM|nr:AMP-binding protein [Aestuariirhabdus litorea]RRJ82531.1 2-succinylbenzoate-CoA ligase [Aestuariirhabdus litorea]RWW92692.1 2-succinylbenzoate-CoA ligase [Endozoicomonadaceae bacterium GTF-13]